MSLLDEYMEETGICVFLDRTTEPDGRGGTIYTYKEGAEFKAAITLSNSIETQKAEMQGVTGIYQVTTPRETRLEYHTVFKRKSDGQIFRVTSKDESKTPASASLNMRVVNAEEYEVPIEEVDNG